MKADVSRFVFDPSGLRLDREKDYVAKIPSGLVSRQKLFEALKLELRLPDYFGYNWNALDECLRDLSWIKQHRVVLLHEDLPQLDAKEISIYLSVLSSGVKDWKVGEDHELVVAFPKDARKAISDIIQRGEN